jgi:site-specific recombinase XerD
MVVLDAYPAEEVLAPVAPEHISSPDRHPALVYLASLSQGSRATMRAALDRIAGMLIPGSDALTVPWQDVRFQHAAAVRSKLAETYAPASCNKMLAALRGVLRASFSLGLTDADTYTRARSIKAVRGSKLPAGRALAYGEIQALFAACDVSKPGGARDAAAVAILYGMGLRRSELVGIDLADFDPATGAIIVRGKGRKERTAYLTNGSRDAVDAWLRHRGDASGPLILPVRKGNRVVVRRLATQGVFDLLARLATRAKVRTFSPHDLRRTFVGDLLDRGADISTVQQMSGHASVTTTARYDRRGEATKRRTSELLHVPFVSR